MPDLDWEHTWSPYDEDTYQAALAFITPDDVVLEIGAGDLRLARRLASRARYVYAIEMQAGIVRQGLQDGPLPPNLGVLVGDAGDVLLPAGVTVGVLLMRHCQHWRLYSQRLLNIGCQRLVTNARWGLDVEAVDLVAAAIPFQELEIGWYACECGHTGFVPGSPELLTPELLSKTYAVYNCPQCQK
ncbi:MAG: rRNA adenine methyltransferase [Anaerolineae bacterium]|nr:rRNA adenine methyltransferase [Anaerolineae bacterium]